MISIDQSNYISIVFDNRQTNQTIRNLQSVQNQFQNVKMLLRTQGTFSSFVRWLPIFQTRIYASSTAPRPDENWEQNKNNENKNESEIPEQDEEPTVATMIGPYISSKQIAFHTEQFDSAQIKKKNKQAFLVCHS